MARTGITSTLATMRRFARLAVVPIAFLVLPSASSAAPTHPARSCGHVDQHGYTPEGLAGTEYTVRCTRGSRVVRLRRQQDGDRR
jgi:hypothetical protein